MLETVALFVLKGESTTVIPLRQGKLSYVIMPNIQTHFLNWSDWSMSVSTVSHGIQVFRVYVWFSYVDKLAIQCLIGDVLLR